MTSFDLHIEKELLTRIASGDERAFKQLFDQYWDNIYGVAYVMTKNREAARDIVQDVFMKMWLMREELLHKNSFRNFLFIVARNHIISELRNRKRNERYLNQLVDYFNEREDNVDQQLLYKESARLVQQAIDQLSPQQREVYLLAREKGWSQDEIAAYLGISKTTIKTHMSRALISIRQYLQQHAGEMLLICMMRALL